jgi:hypothetical protein
VAPGLLRPDLLPGQPLHVAQELDDLAEGTFAEAPRPVTVMLKVKKRKSPHRMGAIGLVINTLQAPRARLHGPWYALRLRFARWRR